MNARSSLLFSTVLLVATLWLVSACESAPPVQEMSDARQAIAVAREAGAEDYAAEQLLEAERFLKSAEEKLSAEQYGEARRDALQAKERALTARASSEEKRPDEK